MPKSGMLDSLELKNHIFFFFSQVFGYLGAKLILQSVPELGIV